MAAKVVWYRDAWWVRVHHKGKKKDRRVGPSKADKRRAEALAEKVDAAITLGQFGVSRDSEKTIPFDVHVRAWHQTYSPTFKPSFERTSEGLIRNHLVPYFGSKDVGSITEEDLLGFIGTRLDLGLAPATVLNALSIVRRVLNLLHRDGRIADGTAEYSSLQAARARRQAESRPAHR